MWDREVSPVDLLCIEKMLARYEQDNPSLGFAVLWPLESEVLLGEEAVTYSLQRVSSFTLYIDRRGFESDIMQVPALLAAAECKHFYEGQRLDALVQNIRPADYTTYPLSDYLKFLYEGHCPALPFKHDDAWVLRLRTPVDPESFHVA